MSEPRPRTPARRGAAPVDLLVEPFRGGALASHETRDRLSRSAAAYVYIHALEETLRTFIADRLFAAADRDPRWLVRALNRIDPDLAPLVAGRKAAAERKRGYLDLEESAPISYLTVAELKSLVLSHWDLFEPELQDKAQFSAVFDVIHVSRNAIAHNRGVGAALVEQLRAQTLHLMSRITGTATSLHAGELDPVEELFAHRYGDLIGTYPTRAAARAITQEVLGRATRIDAMGIALTEIAQMTSLRDLAGRIHSGGGCRLLLCDPGALDIPAQADLARSSIAHLRAARAAMDRADRARMALRITDAPPHLSAYICDDIWAIIQIYPRAERVIEAPVLVARDRGDGGVAAHVQREFDAAWSAAREIDQP